MIEDWSNHAPRWAWWRRVRHWQIGNAPFGLVRGVLIVFLTFGLFLFLFRSAWGLGPLRSEWPWQPAIGVLTVVQLPPHEPVHGLPPHVLQSQLWLVALVGGVLAAVMRWRFLKMELGNRA